MCWPSLLGVAVAQQGSPGPQLWRPSHQCHLLKATGMPSRAIWQSEGSVLNQSVEQCSWNAIRQTQAPLQRCFTLTMPRWPSWAITRICACKLLGTSVQVPHSHHSSRKFHLWLNVRVLAWLWPPEASSLRWMCRAERVWDLSLRKPGGCEGDCGPLPPSCLLLFGIFLHWTVEHFIIYKYIHLQFIIC